MKHIFTLVAVISLLLSGLNANAIANPIEAVNDDDTFEDVLNIDIDADELFTKTYDMSIISDEIGQITFSTENVDGNAVEWTLRFTRKAELDGDVEMFAGMYADDFTVADPFDYTYTEEEDDDDDDETVTVTVAQSASERLDATVYFWSYQGVCYELTVCGNTSNNQFSEVFDSVMAVCFD